MALLLQGPLSANLQVGGMTFTDLKNLIVLHGRFTGTNRATLRRPNTTSGYAVPANHQLRLLAAKITVAATGTNTIATLGYADNDIGFNAATLFANAVQMGETNEAAQAFLKTSLTNPQTNECNFVVPASKYVYCTNNGTVINAFVTAYGYLEPV